MGNTELNLKLATNSNEDDIRKTIAKHLKIKNFKYLILSKSLDARKKSDIHWETRIMVWSEEINNSTNFQIEQLSFPYKKRNRKVLIVGSGPAGFFAAQVLQKAGFDTIIIERGYDVDKRALSIEKFEKTSAFDSSGNYAFGEGGAGTFSDGKLTSRSKHIQLERDYIFQSYIDAGAPSEINYLTHPHLGTDNLKRIVKNLREDYIKLGGKVFFETQMLDLRIQNQRIESVITNKGDFEADILLIATGNSAFDTYKMLNSKGFSFRIKNFALGFRMEHEQELINIAQWGKSRLPGVKAAEYRLTSNADNKHSVYTFCMCPGGVVVPATAFAETNIVNGMSSYNRDGTFANAAVVASVNPLELISNKQPDAMYVLDWLYELEKKFYNLGKGYHAPICRIADFIKGTKSADKLQSSYPLGLQPMLLNDTLPKTIIHSIIEGLKDFNRKLKYFENGNLLGLESKTSAPIQVIRDENRLCFGFENAYFIGEGSGYAGGIASSAADGIKAALHIADSIK